MHAMHMLLGSSGAGFSIQTGHWVNRRCQATKGEQGVLMCRGWGSPAHLPKPGGGFKVLLLGCSGVKAPAHLAALGCCMGGREVFFRLYGLADDLAVHGCCGCHTDEKSDDHHVGTMGLISHSLA